MSLLIASSLYPSVVCAGEDVLLLRQSDAVPVSPLLAHWTEDRFFAGFLTRGGAFHKETHDDSSADFHEERTVAGIGYDRAVSPSVGLALGLQYLNAQSEYTSVHQGVTGDSERALTASSATADSTFKIMDTVVFGLRLGYQLNRLAFDGGEDDTISTWTLGPGVSWKGPGIELSLFHHSKILRQKDDDGASVQRRYGESTLMLTGRDGSRFNWTVWYQKNPLPSCCAFTDRGRNAWGGTLFVRAAGWTLTPGYRYLSAFQEQRNPGSIEDVARHHVWVSAATATTAGLPALSAGYEFAASPEGPSSFQNTEGPSRIKAGRWVLSGSLGIPL